MSPKEFISGLDVGRAVTNTAAAAALAGTAWAVNSTIELQRVQAVLRSTQESDQLAISDAREERHHLEQQVTHLLQFQAETRGNRYTSSDALLHIQNNAAEFRTIWQELEGKANKVDVPPPEVLRRLQAIEDEIRDMQQGGG